MTEPSLSFGGENYWGEQAHFAHFHTDVIPPQATHHLESGGVHR